MTRIAICVLVSYFGVGSLASGQSLMITTVAGGGSSGLGNGGLAPAASLSNPGDVAVDSAGDLFIADTGNNQIREVSAATGLITSIATGASPSLLQPAGVALDAAGNLFIADTGNSLIRELSASGVLSIVAGGGTPGYYGDGGQAVGAELFQPGGVVVDGSGNIFIADTLNNRIREVVPGGVISTFAGNGTAGFSGDGGPATSAELYNPTGVALDNSGNLLIADKSNNRIRKVSNGTITTVAGNGIESYSGDGGPATSAALYNPTGLVVDASGNIYIAVTYSNRIREILASTGVITTIAGDGAQGFYGDGGLATFAILNHPSGVALNASGNLLIADSGNNRIRELSPQTVPAPSISTGGIVPVYSTVATIQSGEWASIYGTNLASSTVTWNGNFPTTLGNTSVTIDGNQAYLWFVSPGQINFQAPYDTTIGPVPVVVTTATGSSTSTVTLAQVAPSFLLLDSKHVTGIILRSNGSGAYGGGTYDILGPTGNSLGYPTVAARAGDTVELSAVGLGPTTPPVEPGQAYTGQATTTNTVSLVINNQNVPLGFAGLASAGLYQINLTVPAGLGTGDVPLAATVGGVQTQSGVVISLQ